MDFETAKQEAMEYSIDEGWDIVVYITKGGDYEWCSYPDYLNDSTINPFQVAYENDATDEYNKECHDIALGWYGRNCQQLTE